MPRPLLRSTVRAVAIASLLLAACEGEPPPAVAPPPSPPPAPVAEVAPPAPPVTGDPTVLTAEQKGRDASRAALATAVVGAYPNWDGFFSSLVANWSPDGKHIVFGSLRDGLPEIYEAGTDTIDAAARAVTSGPERAIWAGYTRDGKSILFLRDHQGDEMLHIWRVQTDGSGLTDLTPGEPMHRGEPVIPRRRPDTMFYDASRVSSPETLVFLQKVAGGEAKVVFRNPRPGGVADVDDDGARALFVDLESNDDQTLLEVDLATGKSHRLYPPEGKAAGITSARYSHDHRVLVTTNEGGEKSVLLSLDGKTGKELGRYVNEAPATAPLQVVPSPTGGSLAIGIDCGNHGEVRILDPKTLKLVRSVNVPLGDVHVGDFRPDGKSFSVLVSTPDRPADVYAVDVARGDVRPLRNDPRPGLAGLPEIHASIASVKAFDGLAIPVNVYLPKSEPGKKLPTVAIFHGGPSSSYAVRWNPYARFFTSLGYAVLEPNVRGSTGFGRAYEAADNREKRADWLKDLESVNAWAKSQAWCDPARVVVWGQSYGGYTTLMALTRQPTLWRAGVDLYGPSDLKAFLKGTDAAIRVAFVSEFGDLDKDGELLDRFSPMRDKDKIVAPLFVYAGAKDPRVPRTESDAIVRALRARSVPVEYMLAENEGHTVDRNETKVELLTRTARFLEDALR